MMSKSKIKNHKQKIVPISPDMVGMEYLNNLNRQAHVNYVLADLMLTMPTKLQSKVINETNLINYLGEWMLLMSSINGQVKYEATKNFMKKIRGCLMKIPGIREYVVKDYAFAPTNYDSCANRKVD